LEASIAADTEGQGVKLRRETQYHLRDGRCDPAGAIELENTKTGHALKQCIGHDD
jgi:hypothetical protein